MQRDNETNLRMIAAYRRSVQAATDPDARDWLVAKLRELIGLVVAANIGLVRRFASRASRSGVDRDQAESAATLALLKAIDGFDPDRGFKFSTYAVRSILCELAREYKAECRHRARFVSGRRDGDDVEQQWEDTNAVDYEQVREDTEAMREMLRHLVDRVSLSRQERLVLQLRHLVTEPWTLEKIGREMRITKERVRQIELVAMTKLRKRLAKRGYCRPPDAGLIKHGKRRAPVQGMLFEVVR